MSEYLRHNIRLYPDEEQNRLFFRYAGAARWAYNESKGISDRYYRKTGKTISRHRILYLMRLERDHVESRSWLSEIPYHILKKAVANYCDARQRYFKGVSKQPVFKKKDKTRPSFFVRTDRYRRVDRNHVKIPGVKDPVRVKVDMPTKIYDPYVIFDGKYWYLSFACKPEDREVPLTDEIVGIDVGIKTLATLSDGRVYANMNKEERVRKQEKRIKREQRKLSRIYRQNGGDKTTAGYRKQKSKLKRAHRRLKNMRATYNHEVAKDIVSSRPKMIVVEDLAVSNLMKNRYLSKAIQDCAFYDLLSKIRYKAELQGTEVLTASRFFPSSKKCHNCGELKKDLTLQDRVYACKCGEIIDRDLNAALNLREYGVNSINK